MKTVVKLRNVSKYFNNKQVRHQALNNISLDICEGEFLAVTGPSGCGKSTLLSILGLMDSPSEGEYELANVLTNKIKANQTTQIRNRHIGFVFQSFNLIDSLTVFENVSLPLEYRNCKQAEINKRVESCLIQVGLEHHQNYKPNHLSGGQQQRVAIARALVGKPDLILVDEPTGNLDTKNGDQVMSLLKELNKMGSTIVMVTHDTRYTRFASRQIQMLDGQIIDEKCIVEVS